MTPEEQLLKSISGKKSTSLNVNQRQVIFLKQLDKQKRSTLSDFQFGKIKTWDDYTRLSGLSPDPSLLAVAPDYKSIKTAFDIKIAAVKAGEELLEVSPHKGATTDLIINNGQPTIDPVQPIEEHGREEDEFSVIDCLRNNSSVIYNKHQEAAAATIVRNLIRHNLHGQGLNARVGSGKTFILGAVLRELWERQWQPLMESIASYPVLYVTRASIVEQTERVLYRKFGLRPVCQVAVTNIDQLRASYGERFIHEKIVVEYGVEHVIYQWLPLVSPSLIILDEAQGVKNIDSKQSRLFQAYNEVEDAHLICASATLFTRVIESKVMAVATRLEW